MRTAVAMLMCALSACGHAPAEGEDPPAGDPVQNVEGEELFAQGVALAQRGDLIRAEQYLSAAMQRGYPEERVMPVLVRVLIASSRLRVALDYASPYLGRHPDDWALRYLVASIHLGMGEPQDARRQLVRVVEAAPDQPEPHYLLAVVLRDELMEPVEAEPHFRRYLELAPSGEHAQEAREALRRHELGNASSEPQTEPAPTTESPDDAEPASRDDAQPEEARP